MKPVLKANLKEGEYKMKYCPYCGAEITNRFFLFRVRRESFRFTEANKNKACTS